MTTRRSEIKAGTVLDVTFRAAPDAIPDARRAIDDLDLPVADEVLDNLRLMVSELVTNSVRHARLSVRDQIRLSLVVRASLLRVEVRDGGGGFEPSTITPSLYQDSGWGLFLVSRLSDRWGVKTNGATVVWFEIDQA